MLKINKIENGSFMYYEATFNKGNLLAFSIGELLSQLCIIHGFKFELFNFNSN